MLQFFPGVLHPGNHGAGLSCSTLCSQARHPCFIPMHARMILVTGLSQVRNIEEGETVSISCEKCLRRGLLNPPRMSLPTPPILMYPEGEVERKASRSSTTAAIRPCKAQ